MDAATSAALRILWPQLKVASSDARMRSNIARSVAGSTVPPASLTMIIKKRDGEEGRGGELAW